MTVAQAAEQLLEVVQNRRERAEVPGKEENVFATLHLQYYDLITSSS